MAPTSQGFGARLLRPQMFLGAISLRTGTEIIALSLFFNKVTGLYGLMAILTGYGLSALQLTMYLYSVAALGSLAWLFPHVRKQEAMPCLGFTWMYATDTIIHMGFTAGFAVDWYLRVGQDKSPYSMLENTTSLGLATFLTLLRVYCCLVAAAYARQVLRREAGGGDEPFSLGTESGTGWQGKAGRYMLSLGKGYWLGTDRDDDGDDDWRRSMGYKYVSGGAGNGGESRDLDGEGGANTGESIDSRIETPRRQ